MWQESFRFLNVKLHRKRHESDTKYQKDTMHDESEEERHWPLWWAGGLSDVSEGCRTRLLLLTSGYRNAPEPTHNLLYKHRAHTHTHTHTHTETYQQAHTHIPLCCELDSTIGASVGQAYYSSPEGVVSLLTGRHKYSSTSSPRVNGCPSGSNETYRVVWARCRHTQYGHFYWNSKVTYGDGE